MVKRDNSVLPNDAAWLQPELCVSPSRRRPGGRARRRWLEAVLLTGVLIKGLFSPHPIALWHSLRSHPHIETIGGKKKKTLVQRLQFPRLRQTKLCLLLKIRTWKMQSSCIQGSGFLDKDWLGKLCLKITLKAYSVLKCKCVYCAVENTIFSVENYVQFPYWFHGKLTLLMFFKSNNMRLLCVAK